MAAGFGVFDLAPRPLQDQRLQVGLNLTLPSARRAGESLLLGRLAGTLGQISAGQLAGDLVADFHGQVFDVEQGARRAACGFFFGQQLLDKVLHTRPQSVRGMC